jgi:hypothetical protein
MDAEVLNWSPREICLRRATIDVESLAADIYARTCRTDFNAPGFCVLNIGCETDSTACRRLMVDLKLAMAGLHESKSGKTLVYHSAARFDQQNSTKPHLDGGPEESLLMLGYEPSAVDAELEITDYAKCAFDMGLTPREFMAQHNPMFKAGYELLRPYAVRIPCFSRTDFQIICINNSSAPYSTVAPAWQGSLHTATILTPDESQRRVVNSTMIAPAPSGASDQISAAQLDEFLHSSAVRRRGYDKQHLSDDD